MDAMEDVNEQSAYEVEIVSQETKPGNQIEITVSVNDVLAFYYLGMQFAKHKSKL